MEAKGFEITNELLGKSTVKRRKAAIQLREEFLEQNCCDLLRKALELEENGDKWQTKVEILKTIGIRGCKSLYSYVDSVFLRNVEFDMVSMVSATTLVRLRRTSLNDAAEVIRLITTYNYSVKEGALEALGYDRMIPSRIDQEMIIEYCKFFGKGRPKGYTDPRYGLAAACAGWDKSLVTDFLNLCIADGDAPLRYVAKKSLVGEYARLR